MIPREELVRRLLAASFLPAEEFSDAARRPAALLEGSVGRPFGRYLVLRKLGEGGFGVVFLAIDPDLNRPLALKVLKRAAPQDLERFRREARAAAAISHPNIVPVYEVGRVQGEAYLAMGYVEGLPPSGKLDPRGAARVVFKIARALGAAHRAGLIHRDVKPQNILLDRTGEPFLTDFGMAKQVDVGPSSLSQSGSVIGTPAYMSPEQARGERALGPASDVFSLGATLYFLAAGRPPFEGESVLEVLRKVVETRPSPPRGIPAPLAAVIDKAMATSPAARYPTALEMSEDLDRFLRGERVRARRLRLVPWLAAGGGLVAAAVLVALPRNEAPSPAPPPPNLSVAVQPPPPPEPVPPAPVKEEKPPEPLPPPPPPPVPSIPEVEPALRARLKERVLDQPEYFRRVFLTEEEERRAREILAAGKAREEEIAFLACRIAEDVGGQIEREKAHLRAAAEEREAAARQVDRPDVVTFADGRRHEGRVLEESEASVKYLYQEAAIQVPRDLVRSVERGGSAEAEFVKKLDALRPGRAAFLELAAWCGERGLERQRDYVLHRALELDPGNALVRRELGLPLAGALSLLSLSAPPPEPRGKSFAYEGKLYAADELRQLLLRRGYVVLDDRWCVVRNWKWSPGAYWKNPSFALGGRGVAVQTWRESRTETVFDLDRKEYVQVVRHVPKFHYVGPVAKSGLVEIEVEAPEPFLECKIKAAATAVEGKGSVEVLLRVGGGEPVRLYSLASGADRAFHDATEAVRGRKKFTLLARLESAEPGHALFLPGDAPDAEPLVVQARLAEPVPSLASLPR